MLVQPRSFFAALVLALVLGGAITAWAQSTPERAAVRLRYGLAFRQGSQGEAGALGSFSHGGMTPNDLGLGAAVYGEGWWGAWSEVRREGLRLEDGAGVVLTGGGLVRASVGPLARVPLGPVRAEVGVGYGFAQLPAFADPWQPRLVPATRHAALLHGRVLVPLPWWHLRAEVRGELPVALVTRDGAGEAASSSGFAAGGALLVPLVRKGAWGGSLVLDYQFVHDRLTTADGVRSRQGISRMGVAFELTQGGDVVPAEVHVPVPAERRAEPEVREEPRVGTLRVSVLDSRGGTPLEGAAVTVRGTRLLTDAEGVARLEGLAPGPVEVSVSAEGFREAQEAVVIVAGTEAELPVSLAFARGSALATLSGQVRSVRKGRPLRAWLVIPEAKLRRRTDSRGAFQVQLKRGRYRLIFSAPGHLTQSKVITVREGEQAIFNVDLFPKSR